ncbi:MAG: EamA family transporter, partial [Candidatus Aenigmarchaeota archaeon]|nr:EamA family transporter [Candidatus Aenigmarchaeota archaeon]
IYAFLSILAIGIVVVLNKIAVDGRDAEAVTWGLMGIAAFCLLPLLDFSMSIPLAMYPYILLVGVLYSAAALWASKSFKYADVSLIAPVKNFAPVVVLILSAVFLREAITLQKIAGIFLIFVGAIALENIRNPHKSIKKLINNEGIKWAFLTMLAMSVAHIIDKYVLFFLDPGIFSVMLYWIIFFMLTLHILFVKKLKLGLETVKKAPSILFFAGFFEALSFYIQLFALKMIDVSLYVPIRRTYSVVVILIACFFLKEKNIKNKFLGAFLMILGVIVLTI